MKKALGKCRFTRPGIQEDVKKRLWQGARGFQKFVKGGRGKLGKEFEEGCQEENV